VRFPPLLPPSDFSNGYLIAECFSRYHPDFELHAFAPGSSASSKRANWALLLRTLDRRGLLRGAQELTRLDVEELIACTPEATSAVLARVYECLTGRSLPSSQQPAGTLTSASVGGASGGGTVLRRAPGSLAPFARPTASYVASITSRQALVEAISDDRLRTAAVGAAVASYEHALVEDRLRNPGRYALAGDGAASAGGAYARRAAGNVAAAARASGGER